MGNTFTSVSISRNPTQADNDNQPTYYPPGSMNQGGAISFTAGQDEVVDHGYASAKVNHNGVPGGSVAATLSKSGAKASVELIPGNPASRTDVFTAQRLGLIERDANGRWVDATSTPAPLEQASQEPQQGTDEEAPGSALFDREDLDAWAEDIAPLPQPSYDAAVAGSINVALGKTDPEAVSKALAKATGMEPELAAQYVEAGFTMYHRAAVKATGMTEEAAEKVFDWAKQAIPTRLQEAIQRLVYAQDGSLFGELARDFRVANPPDLSAFREQGFQTAIDRETGEVMVQMPGGSWRSLSELGR